MYSKEAFEAMTVVELRKVARENGVTLSAGISKQGIVERLCAALVKPGRGRRRRGGTARHAHYPPRGLHRIR